MNIKANFLKNLLLLLALILILLGDTANAQTNEPKPRLLAKGERVENLIKGGENPRFVISAEKDSLVYFAAEQIEIDIALNLYDENNQFLTSASETETGAENLYFYTDKPTKFIVELVLIKWTNEPLKYAVQFAPPFASTEAAQLGLGKGLVASANILINRGDTKNAIQLFEKSLEIWNKLSVDSDDQAQTLFSLGSIYFNLKEDVKAIDFYAKARAVYHIINDKPGEAASLINIAKLYQRQNKSALAIETAQIALTVVRQTDKRLNEGNILLVIADVYGFQLNRYAEAVEYYAQAEKVFKQSGDAENLLVTMIGEASTLSDLGRYEQALQKNEEAGEIAFERKDYSTAVTIIINIGNIYTELGQYDKSLETELPGLEIARKIKNPEREMILLNNIGIVYLRLGSLQKAQIYLQDAAEKVRQSGDKVILPESLTNLGAVAARLKQYAQAIAYLEESLPLLRENNDYRFIAINRVYAGTICRETNEIEKAVANHQEAILIARQSQLPKYEARASLELGFDYLANRKPDLAVPQFERAFIMAQTVNARDEQSAALDGLMQSAKLLGRKSLAIFYGKQAVNLLQTTRRDIAGTVEKQDQADFVKDNERTYRQLAQILIAANRFAEAEQVTDLLKQEEYFGFLRRDSTDASAAAKDTAYTPVEAAARADYLKKAGRITELGRQYETLKNTLPQTPEIEKQILSLDKDIQAASGEFQTFLDKLVTALPDTQAGGEQKLRVSDSEAFMDTLRELGEETGQPVAAIYTIVGENELTLMVVTATTRVAETVNIKREELDNMVAEFRAALRNPNADPRPAGQKLYDKIFAPIEKHILPLTKSADGKTNEIITLMWSLDGTLRYVPTTALWDGKKYLVERFRNTVFTFKSKDKLKDKPSAKWSALGLGVTEQRTEGTDYFNALPAVNAELALIGDGVQTGSTIAPPLSGKTLRDKEFTKEALQTELRLNKRPVIHIASHFSFKPTSDDESFLLLGSGKFTVTDMRKAGQLFSRVELLTLSACNTGVGGRDSNGKEIDGFGAFAQDKGAQAVIATLWSIEDGSTAQLMHTFYGLRAANSTPTKAEDLRQAQLALLTGKTKSLDLAKTKDLLKKRGGDSLDNDMPFAFDAAKPYAHPYFWSPFVLIGNWR